jgi:hypothetical protein
MPEESTNTEYRVTTRTEAQANQEVAVLNLAAIAACSATMRYN